MQINDIQMTLSLLPDAVFKTLVEKIYGKFPRPSAIDRQHAKILFAAELIEKSEMGLAPKSEGDTGAHNILVPTLACQNALIAMGFGAGERRQ